METKCFFLVFKMYFFPFREKIFLKKMTFSVKIDLPAFLHPAFYFKLLGHQHLPPHRTAGISSRRRTLSRRDSTLSNRLDVRRSRFHGGCLGVHPRSGTRLCRTAKRVSAKRDSTLSNRKAGVDALLPAGVDVVRKAEMGVDIPAVQSKNDNFSSYAQNFFCCFFRQKLFIEQNFSINFQK
jgi:hypothetical protein